jgi:hypothetical protein
MSKINKEIFKWIIVILTLLFIPYGLIITLSIFCVLFIGKRLTNLDLILLYFLIFFVQNASGEGEAITKNLKYILIFVSFLLTVGQKGFSIRPLFSKAFCFPVLFLFLLIHSLIFSYDSANSLVEELIFGLMIIFTYKNTYFENIYNRKKVLINIEAMYIALLLSSVFSFLIPSISYLRNGVGFQGVSIHPNAFGIVMAPFCGLLLLRLFQKCTTKDLVLFVLSFSFIYLSQSRTSLLSIFLGLFTLMVINSELRRLISKKMLAVLIFSSLFFLFYYDKINNLIYSFLNKTNSATITDSILSSRGKLIENQMVNIENHLFFGIGFKIPSDLKPVQEAFSIGKDYEKGNALLAGVEELGIIGAIVLLITIIYILKIRNNKNNIFLILPLIALFTTMGEATLFSIGGAGILVWTLIFICMHNGFLEQKIENRKKFAKTTPK